MAKKKKLSLELKQSSYQKLKNYNEVLTKQIIVLVEDTDKYHVAEIKANWKLRLSAERAMWFGTHC